MQAGRRFFLSDLVSVGVLRRVPDAYSILAYASAEPRIASYLVENTPSFTPDNLDPYARFPHYCGTLKSIGVPTPGAQDFLQVVRGDIVGVVGLADEYSVSFGVAYPVDHLRLPAREQRLLVQIALHLEAGLRLRLEPTAVLGVLGPDGRLLHAEGELTQSVAHERLSQHVKGVERMRLRRHRSTYEAADTWTALVSGAWGIVERVEADGRRSYSVIDTRGSQRLRQLSDLETRVVELSARGLTGKAVAYALGVQSPAVSQALLRAAIKLGLHSRTEVVALASRLLGAPRDSERHAELTAAEREVLALVRMGYTNAAIAEDRRRSERTVANQVASILHKLDAPSRRALAAQ